MPWEWAYKPSWVPHSIINWLQLIPSWCRGPQDLLGSRAVCIPAQPHTFQDLCHFFVTLQTQVDKEMQSEFLVGILFLLRVCITCCISHRPNLPNSHFEAQKKTVKLIFWVRWILHYFWYARILLINEKSHLWLSFIKVGLGLFLSLPQFISGTVGIPPWCLIYFSLSRMSPSLHLGVTFIVCLVQCFSLVGTCRKSYCPKDVSHGPACCLCRLVTPDVSSQYLMHSCQASCESLGRFEVAGQARRLPSWN